MATQEDKDIEGDVAMQPEDEPDLTGWLNKCKIYSSSKYSTIRWTPIPNNFLAITGTIIELTDP